MPEDEKEHFLNRLSKTLPILEKVKKNESKLVISSTSWTKDEDFSILLDALVAADDILNNSTSLRATKLAVLITGKGPEKAFYLAKIGRLSLKNIEIATPWLEADDYPRLLGCAHLGISLHSSSSGVDLPMKARVIQCIGLIL